MLEKVKKHTVKYDGNASTIKGSTVTGSIASQTEGQELLKRL